jgi:hypothetical protein
MRHRPRIGKQKREIRWVGYSLNVLIQATKHNWDAFWGMGEKSESMTIDLSTLRASEFLAAGA